MDELLERFHLDTKLHEYSMEHSKAKGMKLNDLNVFFQPESWDILTEMIANGEYVTPPSEQHYKDKVTGDDLSYKQAMLYKQQGRKVRELNVLPLLDRVVWNAFSRVVYDEFEHLMDENCVSYKRGIGTSKIGNNLQKELIRMHKYKGVKGDFEKFFDRVPIERIDECFEMMSTACPSAIWKPIIDCYHDHRLIVNGEIVEAYTSLRQGNPMSTILANLILRDVDAEMKKFDVVYLRYSDDFVLIGREYREAFKRMQEMLREKGIKLNDEKTEFISDEDWFEFLGFSFKREKRSVASKTLRNLEHEIKTRTMSKTRQAHRPATKNELRKMIKDLQWYFFTAFAKSQENFGMGVYLFGSVNVIHDLQAIDEYCKDCLRAAYTNKSNIHGLGYVKRNGYVIDDKNVSHNFNGNMDKTRTSDGDLLEQCGWVSLMKMYNDYHTNMDLFENSVFRMVNGTF